MTYSGWFKPSLRTVAAVTAAVFLILYLLWTYIPESGEDSSDTLLTLEERAWLDANPEKLTLFYNTDFPPIEFAGEDGSFIGLGADVASEVERRLGIEFIRIPCEDWNLHLQALEYGDCAVAPTIVRTDERENYSYFTAPYASVPVVIITTSSSEQSLTLEDLEGKRVAVVSGFATEEYLMEASRGSINLVPMWNVPQALRAVSFGEVDALVENLAVAAWYTDEEGLSNLRVAGVTDYYFQWSIGVSRKYPLLFSSIQKALADIPRSELEEMYGSWISMRYQRGVSPGILRKIHAVSIFALLLLFSLTAITLYLRRRLNEKVKNLRKTQAELLEQTERLRHAEKMEALGNLAGGIAHDFNNLLQVISGYTQLLLASEDLSPGERTGLEHISGAGRRAATLIGQLMAFSRHMEFRKIPVDVNAEVVNAVEMLRQTIPKMIEISTDLQANLPPVLADPVHLEQVIFNLAGNSVDAMPRGGELYIATEKKTLEGAFCTETGSELNGIFIVLTVKDTGSGISREVQKNMYDPFYTTKEPGRGTGLGLASVYGIVKSLGGCIRCSSSENQGTAFMILLPATDDAVPDPGEIRRNTKPQRGSGETIMVVDDEPDITEQSKEFLSELGYRMLCASSGEEALELKKTEKPDLILLDLNMPGMGGYRCLQELKKIDPDQKVLIVSGHSEYDVNLDDLMKKSSGFLRKPYRLDTLAQRIQEILKG